MPQETAIFIVSLTHSSAVTLSSEHPSYPELLKYWKNFVNAHITKTEQSTILQHKDKNILRLVAPVTETPDFSIDTAKTLLKDIEDISKLGLTGDIAISTRLKFEF